MPCDTCGKRGFNRCHYDYNCWVDFLYKVRQSSGFSGQCYIPDQTIFYPGIPYSNNQNTAEHGIWRMNLPDSLKYIEVKSKCHIGYWNAYYTTDGGINGWQPEMPGFYGQHAALPAACATPPDNVQDLTLQNNCEGYHHIYREYYNPQETEWVETEMKITVFGNNACSGYHGT
jgi:hypothetical protein